MSECWYAQRLRGQQGHQLHEVSLEGGHPSPPPPSQSSTTISPSIDMVTGWIMSVTEDDYHQNEDNTLMDSGAHVHVCPLQLGSDIPVINGPKNLEL